MLGLAGKVPKMPELKLSRGKDHLWPQGGERGKKKSANQEERGKISANQSYLESEWNSASNVSLRPKQRPLFMHSSKGSLHHKAPSGGGGKNNPAANSPSSRNPLSRLTKLPSVIHKED